MGRHYLEHLFTPASIAVFGVSEKPDWMGGRVCRNLKASGFAGPVYAIGSNDQSLDGQICFASLDAVDGPVDLAVIATPADTVPALIRACGEHHVNTAIVLSIGSETQESADAARRHSVRILGPHSLGVMRPSIGLNATFSNNTARRGPLALVSQSGAICAAILDWAEPRGIGFSSVVSLGEASDIGLGDSLDYLSMDTETRSILVYMEDVGDARCFMSGLRAAARMKPVVIVKAGRKEPPVAPLLQRGESNHIDSQVGADAVFNAALERAGAVRAGTIGQLFAAARLLSTPCRAKGNRLAIVTNAGGPGIMAADWAAKKGVALAELGEATLLTLDTVLPRHGSRGNPLDLQGKATPRHYQAALEACLSDEAVDGILAMLTPQALTQATETAQALAQVANPRQKPILACWLGGPQVLAAREFFDRQGIPSFANPESAVVAFGFLAAYRRNQELLRQTPGPLAEAEPSDIAGARRVIGTALEEKRSLLSWPETRAVLRAFGIPLPPSDIEGGSAGKINGKPHGRKLSLGILDDPVFGPAIRFGAGGAAAEIPQAHAVALPPLNDHLARAMIAQARIAKLPPVNRESLVRVLLRISAMACELPQIQAMDIDPLAVDGNGIWALDARILVRATPPGRRPYDHMAIHPYPSHLVSHFQLANGTDITIRPIRPEDAEIEQAFVRHLSPEAKRFRFMETLRELSLDMLVRFTQIDYSRDLAFIATLEQDGAELEIGVARYFTNPDGTSGEFALAVADGWQNLRIGTRLMGCIIEAARERGFYSLEGEVLADNPKMLRLMDKLGFSRRKKTDEPSVVVVTKAMV